MHMLIVIDTYIYCTGRNPATDIVLPVAFPPLIHESGCASVDANSPNFDISLCSEGLDKSCGLFVSVSRGRKQNIV